MTDSEHHLPDRFPDEHHHIPSEYIEALKDSSFDVNAFYKELKEGDGKMLLALDALAERFRKDGVNTAELKRGIVIGMLLMLKLVSAEDASKVLTETYELPEYTDDLHTPTDTNTDI